MLCEMGAAAPGCMCLMSQHCSRGCEVPSPVNPTMRHMAWKSALALKLLCVPDKGIKPRGGLQGRGLQVLGGHTMPLTLEGKHRGTLKTTRTDSHPVAPRPAVQ